MGEERGGNEKGGREAKGREERREERGKGRQVRSLEEPPGSGGDVILFLFFYIFTWVFF